ncbi:MAG: hypothetical protein E7415_00745 [Ruminococcaceae bacterium]|nr:hypothetical protein [Oscillospiraceae bacterium]
MKMPNGIKIGIAAGVCAVIITALPVVANPGSESDPLISKSYITDTVMPQLQEYVKEEVKNQMSGAGEHNSERFEVVSLTAGQKLMCENGTELILRMGSATVIATEKGGLADTTAGVDLANGTAMPSNHLLIVPVNDGRGITANNDVLVMVKGAYTIQ